MKFSVRSPSRPPVSFLLTLVLSLAGGSLSALEARMGILGGPPGTLAGEVVAEGGPEWFSRAVKAELGLELGWTPDPRLLVPFGPSWETYLEDGWGWGAAVHALGGYRFGGDPRGLWGGEAEIRTEYSWVPGLALGLTAGVRYVEGRWEFPLHLVVEIPLGPEDALELGPGFGSGEQEKHEP